MNIESLIIYIDAQGDYIEVKLHEKDLRNKLMDKLNATTYYKFQAFNDIIIASRVIIKKIDTMEPNNIRFSLPVHDPTTELDDVLAMKLKDQDEFLKFGDFLRMVSMTYELQNAIQNPRDHSHKICYINDQVKLDYLRVCDKIQCYDKYIPCAITIIERD